MSTGSDTVLATLPAGEAAAARTRPLYWAVRRELWEHRAIYLAPLVVAAFAVLVHFLNALAKADAPHTGATHVHGADAYGVMSAVVVAAGLLVGALYSAGAFYGERRDRSILFWKSLPVSDLTTVLAKAAVPLLVLPIIIFAVVLAATTAALLLQALAFLIRGLDPGSFWPHVDLPFVWLSLLYGLPFMALWYAPIYAWLLLMSAWAPRWPFLWAAAPLVAALIVEHTALSATAAHWGVERYLGGGVLQPYVMGGGYWTEGLAQLDWIESLSQLEPARLYTQPALWIGVALAAVFLFAAARLRRTHGPI